MNLVEMFRFWYFNNLIRSWTLLVPFSCHNNVKKETVQSISGEKFVMNRQKRVLKVHLIDILKLAQKEIGFKYSLRTLMNLRPSWVLLSKEAHILNCLCDRCANILEILRCLCNFVQKIKQHGSPSDKSSLVSFELSTSISDFMMKILHPKLEGQMWHRPECYTQTCNPSTDFPCGTQKLMLFFEPLFSKFGERETDLYQHKSVPYTKADGSMGTKFEQVLTKQSIISIVELLDNRVFGTYHKQPYVEHRLKMLLACKMRKDIHQNLEVTDAVCWTDFSKAVDVNDQETCKSSAFGASNTTIELIGQVFELVVLPPSSPTLLCFNTEVNSLTFSKPNLDGGSNIQHYEVHVKCENTDMWYLLDIVKVKYLSQDPIEVTNLFGRLSGVVEVRVFARNLCGLGPCSEISVQLQGDLPFLPQNLTEISEDSFTKKYATFYAEFFFFSDHNDADKNWQTILKCKEIALAELRAHFCRDITRLISVSDTGGENNGSTALCCYSFAESDLGVKAVWAPTAAHHSGQLSDSACGTLKRMIKNDLKSGKVKVLNTAAKMVQYCSEQPMMREVTMSKFLRAKTVLRSYHHVTKEIVEGDKKADFARREVKTLVGVSQLKQAFSLGEKYKLLVRKQTCCCKSCLLAEFETCDIKDYTGLPKTVSFTPARRLTVPRLRSRRLSPVNEVHNITEGGGEDNTAEDPVNTVEDPVNTDEDAVNTALDDCEHSEVHRIVTEPGKLYVVLGDSVEGYYYVKCLASSSDYFVGNYLSVCSDDIPDNILVSETRETDNFYYNSIISEVFSVTEIVSRRQKKFTISKVELNEILVLIAEMSDT